MSYQFEIHNNIKRKNSLFNNQWFNIIIFLTTIFIFNTCQQQYPTPVISKTKQIDTCNHFRIRDTSTLEKILIQSGLINCKTYDSTIIVDLKYSSSDNFLGIDLYGNFNECYLQPDVAKMLADAQMYLHDTIPSYKIKVYDAARPLSIQKMMWDSLKIPENLKYKYLSNPQIYSLHNFGAAVDVTICDENNIELDMGTPFDCFEELAYPILEKKMLAKKLLNEKQIANRELLRYVMNKAGFKNIQTEWWHFNACSRKQAKEHYAIILHHELTPQLVSQPVEVTSIETQNIYFKVQIKISITPLSLNSEIFKGLQVNMYKHEGYYKYTTGKFSDLASAHELCFKLRDSGFSDAFVVAFNNNIRISVKDAIELLQ